MKRELANTKENAKKEMDVLTDELERTKAELAATQTYEGKRTKSDLDAAKNIYICPSDNTVDLRNLLSRMKCLL